MKKLQLYISYALNNKNAFDRVSIALDVMVYESYTAEQKTALIINEIVKYHNTNSIIHSRFGIINFNDVIIHLMTRLD